MMFDKRCLVGALALGMMLPAYADDTEIYVGSGAESQAPNVLFVVDTSGSMDESELVMQSPYDPNVDYEGDCDDDHIYWASGAAGTPPSCDTERYILRSASICGDITNSVDSDAGMAITEAAQDRGGFLLRWLSLQAGNHTDDVDCRSSLLSGTYQFYSANYVNWFHSEGGGRVMTRMEIVQDVAKDLVDSISGVNIGLARFDQGPGGQGYGDQWDGGYIDIPIDPIADNRTLFKDAIDSYTPLGSTPLSETMYEVTQYWRGGRLKYGNRTNPRQSAPRARKGANYISPIEHSCQKNHIVYLTDGEPQYDNDADDDIEALVGAPCSGNCLDELAQFLYENDQRPDIPGLNNVITHTIGFHTDQDLLRAAARKGGGNYYTADNYDALKTSLTALFTEILSGTSLFTAPAVSVNAFNRLSHLDQIYFALFRPEDATVWSGNVKRYRMDAQTGQLVDVNDQPAVKEATGEFADDARSFWSGLVDGNDVRLGGMAGELGNSRNVYTYVGTGTDVALSNHPLSEDNAELTPERLGLSAGETAYRERLLRWARGIDVDDVDGDGDYTDPRRQMGDPLHSKPVLVNYGTDPDDPQLTMFVTTNEGYLHAVDTDSGAELFAYMPGELLPNIKAQYENTRPADADRTYGLDGPLSVSLHDGVQLFFGQRRGGRHYYALDVSSRTEPRLLWTITGGLPDDPYEELGQTWSRPIPTRIDIGGEVRNVLIFAGGYDPGQDQHAVRTEDTQGRALFIADARTGQKLWSGGPSGGSHDQTFADMNYSIPSDVRVLDIDGDGLADQIYVGDMGGQLWRFDIHNGEPSTGLVTGGVVADLAEDDDSAHARRFYYPPDIALISERGSQWLSMSIGSGWRAHPVDTAVQDRFYMIRNANIFAPPTDANGTVSYAKLDEDDLYDATENLIAEAATEDLRSEERLELYGKRGWYIRLNTNGEKVMAESVTLDGQLLFTTYQPSAPETVASCGPGAGKGRAYAVNLVDATPVHDRDGSGELEAADRAGDLARGGIPPAPTPIFIDGKTRVLVGPEQIEFEGDARRHIIYWREQ